MAQIAGTDNPETITGTPDDDVITGGGDPATVDPFATDDTIDGGGGNDQIEGGHGNDIVRGGGGNDILKAELGGSDRLYGDAGDDHLVMTARGTPPPIVDGGDGDDVIEVSAAQTTIRGGAGNDLIHYSGGTFQLIQGSIDAGSGNDRIVYSAPPNRATPVILGDGTDVVELHGPGVTISDFAAGDGGDKLDLGMFGFDPFADGTFVVQQNGADVRIVQSATEAIFATLQNVQAANLTSFNLNGDTPPGGFPMSYPRYLDEFQVNSYTPSGQYVLDAVGLQNGGFIVSYTNFTQIFDGDGNRIGPETPGRAQTLTTLASGNVVIGWSESPFSNGGFDVKAKIIDPAGTVVRDTFLVHTDTTNEQYAPDVAALASGGFVVTYRDERLGGFEYHSAFAAQLFDADGNKIGLPITVGDAYDVPRVTGLANGGFAVMWNQSGGAFSPDSSLRIYDPAGAPIGGQIDFTDDRVGQGEIIGLPAGGFAIVWGTNSVQLQIFDDNGAAVGLERQFATGTAGIPDINVLASGELIVSWTAYETSGSGISAQLLSAAGDSIGGPFEVNTVTNGDQSNSRLAALSDGGFVVAWNGPDASDVGVHAQIFRPQPPETVGTGGADSMCGQSPGSADRLVGLAGNDFYLIDNTRDVIGEAPGEGFDRAYATVRWVLTDGAEVEYLSTSDHRGTATTGLTGNGFDQYVVGNDGANTLDGRGGADILVGWAGNDSYAVDNIADRVEEIAGDGFDSVYSSTGYVLTAGMEIELLSADSHAGTQTRFLWGNEFNQIIQGNAGANSIDGGGGADILVGWGGDDTYAVDNQGDAVHEARAAGYDTVFATVNYALLEGTEVERLSAALHAGTQPIRLIGNSTGQLIQGNAGHNLIDGRGGGDVMVGWAGNDVYYVDHLDDQALEEFGEGTDTVYTSVSHRLILTKHVETLSTDHHAGTTAIDLTGNSIANLIQGNAGHNTIDGKEGSDNLVGFGGSDRFVFSTALGVSNIDTIFGFAPQSDLIVLDDAIFTGLSQGQLAAQAFRVGAGAADASDRIIYNPSTGGLLFDSDGNGAAAAIQFGILGTGMSALTAADFQII